MKWLILKQSYSDYIVKILFVWINRNYFLKLIAMFELIEKFSVQTIRVFELLEVLPY